MAQSALERKRLALLMLLSLPACAEETTTFLAWPNVSLSIAGLARVDGADVEVVGEPFGLEDGAVTFGAERLAAMIEPETELLLVGLDAEEFDEIAPDVDRPQLSASSFAVAPVSEECLVEGERQMDTMRVPTSSTAAWLGGPDRAFEPAVVEAYAAQIRRLSFDVPLRPFGCETRNEGLIRPWLEDVDVVSRSLVRHHMLGRDRIVLVGDEAGGVHIVDRTQTPPVTRSWRWRDMPFEAGVGSTGADRVVRHSSLRSDPDPHGRHHLVVAINHDESGGSSLYEIVIDGDTLSWGGRLAHHEAKIKAVLVDSAGGVVAVSEEGHVLTTGLDRRALVVNVDYLGTEFSQAERTGDARDPHVLASQRGSILIGDALRPETLEEDALAATSLGTVEVHPIEPGILGFWMATSGVAALEGSFLRHRTSRGNWRTRELDVPSVFPSICAADAPCGRREQKDSVRRLRSHRPSDAEAHTMYAIPRWCRALMVFPPDRLCTTIIPVDSDGIPREPKLWELDRFEALLTISDIDGRLYELALDP